MSNAKVRHRRRRRAKRNALHVALDYTPMRDLDWCFEDTYAGRSLPRNQTRGRLGALFAVAALATLGMRL